MPVHRHKKDTTTPRLAQRKSKQPQRCLTSRRSDSICVNWPAVPFAWCWRASCARSLMRSSVWAGENAAGSSKGYRNGSYTRDLVTSSGQIEDIKVPRDREGQFHTQAFERYSRYEPHVAEGLTQMFVAGTSTHKVGEVAQTLMGVAPSASTISRLNQTLTQQFDAWRERSLQEHWRNLYLDGVHFSIRHGDQADSTLILTALGVDLTGNKEVLARPCLCRGKQGGMAQLATRSTSTRSHPDRSDRDGWTRWEAFCRLGVVFRHPSPALFGA
jgi:hypothetical protein